MSTFQLVEFGIWIILGSEHDLEGRVFGGADAAKGRTGVGAETQAGVLAFQKDRAGQGARGNGAGGYAF